MGITATPRPWTVHLLVWGSIAGAILGRVFDPRIDVWDLVGLLVSALFAWGMWQGRPWAFTISFMLTSLCLALIGLAWGVAAFLDQDVPDNLWIGVAFSGVWLALLLHPATKQFWADSSHGSDASAAGSSRTGARTN